MGIVVTGVGKEIGDPPTRILSDIAFRIDDGEFVALTGRSGSGKSTLLYILSSLDRASSGLVHIDGFDVNHTKAETLSHFRNQHMGFVFQFHYLIAELTAFENVLFPARKTGAERTQSAYAEALLGRFGLGDKMQRLPRQLSGGEQQRVAIARALVMKPKYLFADEPTGSLDSVSGEQVMDIIRDCNTQLGTTVIMVTHDPDFARQARRQIHLADGKIVSAA